MRLLPPILHSYHGYLLPEIFPIFPNLIVIICKYLNFSFIRQQEMSPKIKIFVLIIFLYSFNFAFGVMPSSVLVTFQPMSLQDCFTVKNETFAPVSVGIFMKSLAFVLRLILIFHANTSKSLRHRTCLLPEPYDVL